LTGGRGTSFSVICKILLPSGNDEELMSYDRLRIDRDLRDAITVRGIGSGTYRAIAIPPTFTLGPVFAHRLLRIREFDAAIRKADISGERVEFLLRRLEYWRNWASRPGVSIISSGDFE